MRTPSPVPFGTSTAVFYCWCHSDSASVLLYFTFCNTCSLCRVELVVQFPARGSTQVLLCLFLVCCGCDTSYIVSVHIQCQASIYTLSLCRGRLAKQETLTPPGHLVSPLVCRSPWISTVVLYCWCHSDSASVLLYFVFVLMLWQFSSEFVLFPDRISNTLRYFYFASERLFVTNQKWDETRCSEEWASPVPCQRSQDW